MEVYTALYDNEMKELSIPKALIINENSFAEVLSNQKVYFFGSGAAKFEAVLSNKKCILFIYRSIDGFYEQAVFERFG